MSLYENIRKKKERIKAGSGEKMRKPNSKGAPSDQDFKNAAKTAKYTKGQKKELKASSRKSRMS